MTNCTLCTDKHGLGEQIWSGEHWRLTMPVGESGVVAGFSILTPVAHIPHITDLHRFPGAARSFGDAIGRCSEALKEATGASLVYVYVFGGGIPHFHVHLAPHQDGGPLNEAIIKGEVEERRLASGAMRIISKDYPPVSLDRQRAVAVKCATPYPGGDEWPASFRAAIPVRHLEQRGSCQIFWSWSLHVDGRAVGEP